MRGYRTIARRGTAFAHLDDIERSLCQFACKLTTSDTPQERNGIGSGILLGSDVVLTCYHCVPQESELFVSFGHYESAKFKTQIFRKVTKRITPRQKDEFSAHCEKHGIKYAGDIAFLELESPSPGSPFSAKKLFPGISQTGWSSETHEPIVYYGYCYGSNLKISRKLGVSRKLTEMSKHAHQTVLTKSNKLWGVSEKTGHPEVYTVSPVKSQQTNRQGKPKVIWSSPEHGVHKQLRDGSWKPYANSAEFDVMFPPFIARDHFLTNLDTAPGGSGGVYVAKKKQSGELEIVGLHIGELPEMLPVGTTPLHLAVYLHVSNAASMYDPIVLREKKQKKATKKTPTESKAESKDDETDDALYNDDYCEQMAQGLKVQGLTIGTLETTPKVSNDAENIPLWVVKLMEKIVDGTDLKFSEESPLKSYFFAHATGSETNPTDDDDNKLKAGAYRRHFHIWVERDNCIALQYKDTMTDGRFKFKYYLVSINVTIQYCGVTIHEVKVVHKPTQKHGEGFKPIESSITTYCENNLNEPNLIEDVVHRNIISDILALKGAFETFAFEVSDK